MTAPTGWDRLLSPLLSARRFDEVLLRGAEHVIGVFHVSIGMEATAAALACVKSEHDVLMLGHRNHAHLVSIGSDPEVLYREMLGRDGGPQRGRGGSLHLADPARGVPYTSAMLGGSAALANGIALALGRRRTGGIAFACFGDGAMGEGLLYETIGLACAWQLPIVFVCESNALERRHGELATRARAHGLPAHVSDARRPRAVVRALDGAAQAARAGDGPQFLEARSAPWPGNSSFIPHLKRAFDLAASAGPPSDDPFAAHDPVRCEARALLDEGVPMERLLELDACVSDRMRAAFDAAAAAPGAPARVALEDVWG
jgi:TPP-dependent pyruvate/acetoin dehydrogenase alpha subunit